MATITSVGTGLWSAAGTWDAGVPGNGDTVIVAVGHTVTFDADQSGFAAGLAALTLNGTLRASEIAGNYVLKLAGNIGFGAAGVLQAGESASVLYPSTCTFQISLAGSSSRINAGTNTVRLYGPAPTNMYVKLSGNEAIGQTAISVDTDVTADAMWAVGATIAICDINQAQEYELYTLQSVAATEITLTSGLTVAKSTGAYLALSTRNIRIIGPGGTNTAYGMSGGANNVCQGVEFRALNRGLASATSAALTACAITGNGYGLYSITSAALTTCAIAGNSNGGLYICTAAMLVGCTLAGNGNGGLYLCASAALTTCAITGHGIGLYLSAAATLTTCAIAGNTQGMNQCATATLVDCILTGNTQGLYQCSGRLINTTLGSNTYDLRGIESIIGINCTLDSVTQNYEYAGGPAWQQTVIWDIGEVEGAIKAWMDGGRVIPDGTVYPTGYTTSHKFIHEDGDSIVYLDFPVLLTAEADNLFTVFLRRDTASMTENPRVQLIDPASDPLFGGTALEEHIMTAAVDTWEQIDIEYEAARLIPNAILRVYARNASGNSWCQVNVPAPAAAIPTLVDQILTATITEDAITVEVTD